MSLLLRPAEPRDVPVILAYIKELALYERDPDAVVATEAGLQQHLFGEAPKAEVIMAEWAGEPAGFALYFTNFSTWTGKPGLYLEDLFVREAYRGKGVGKALLLHLARLANQRGYGRMDWWVLDWNMPAIDFYKSLGAMAMDEWTTFRLDADALARLAGIDETTDEPKQP